VIEVGAWAGRSSIALALANQRNKDCRTVSIDLFPSKEDWRREPNGSYSMSVEINGQVRAGYQTQNVWHTPFVNDVLPTYKNCSDLLKIWSNNIDKAGLKDSVIPYRGTINDFLGDNPDERIKLAFLDGDHGYEALMQDIQAVKQALSPNGWLCFDDAYTCYEGVDQALNELTRDPDFDHFQKVGRKLFIARKKSR